MRLADPTNREPKPEPDSPPSFAWWRERLVAAEETTGWLDECDDAGRFLAPSRELIDALATVLRRLAGDIPVLEICAGSGDLARALAAHLPIEATDPAPRQAAEVAPLPATDALRRFRPTVVLGAFVPFDAGVDEAVLACPSVRHYVVLGARLCGSFGASALWQTAGWKAEPLPSVRKWMLTRHDVWLGGRPPGCSNDPSPAGSISRTKQLGPSSAGHAVRDGGDVLRHGEAWLFSRTTGVSPSDGGQRR